MAKSLGVNVNDVSQTARSLFRIDLVSLFNKFNKLPGTRASRADIADSWRTSPAFRQQSVQSDGTAGHASKRQVPRSKLSAYNSIPPSQHGITAQS